MQKAVHFEHENAKVFWMSASGKFPIKMRSMEASSSRMTASTSSLSESPNRRNHTKSVCKKGTSMRHPFLVMNNPEASLEVSVSRTRKVAHHATSYISSLYLDLKHKFLLQEKNIKDEN
jgi:hypothetical protein